MNEEIKKIKEMIDKVKNFNLDKNTIYKVIPSRDYYSTNQEIIFTGSYEDCIKVIRANSDINLEMQPMYNQVNENVSDNSINLAIIGSRSFNNYSYAKDKILEIIQKNNLSITKIISGGAIGADKIAETFALKLNIPIEVIKADWSKGKAAGVIRNSEIINKSNVIIAFWDEKSKGTLDSINKAKRANKKVFIVKISPENINEGVRFGEKDEYIFDFKQDNKDDIMSLKFNKNYITKKKTDGLISYFSYKINKKIEKDIRNDLLVYIKNDLKKTENYEHFLNKSILGLFNNPNIDVSDVGLILIPESSSTLNYDLAKKIKDKLPNALFLKDSLVKNSPENVVINYDYIKEKGIKQDTVLKIEKMVQKGSENQTFKMKKVAGQFRKFILNFLVLDDFNRKLMNKITNGKVLIIDDIVSEGTTFRKVNRLIETYAPEEIIYFSLIA